MKKPLRRKPLPVSPSLEHLRKQAKKRCRENPSLILAAAQREVAQEYGFRNWAELAREVEAIAKGAGSKTELLDVIRGGDLAGAIRLLDQCPRLLDVDLWPVAMFQAASPPMTRLLLARGLDPNRSSSPRKPLHFAVDQGWPEIVEELLQHGADPNIRDGEGFTPLDLYGGLVRGSRDAVDQIVETLKKAGAEVNVWTGIRIGDTDRALELLRHQPGLMNEGSPDLGFLPLHVASQMANGAVVRWLLDHGADVNGANPLGNTALWFVCQSGAEVAARLEVARMFIAAGADVNRRCENGSTALCYAAWRGPSAMVELLLSEGAQVWIGNSQETFPLDYATGSNVSEDKDKIVERLSRAPI